MKKADIGNFLSSFKETLEPTPEISQVPSQSEHSQSLSSDYWIPSASYCRTERQMFDEFHDRWKTIVADRPSKTLADAELSITQFYDFASKNNHGLFRRRSFFRFRDYLLTEKHLHPKTIGKRLTYLRSMLQAAEDEEVLPANPVRRIKIPTSRNLAVSRIAFSEAVLAHFFSSPVYTKRLRLNCGAEEAIFWIPLIAVYSGMRIEEIAQLRIRHIQREGAI